ncbi:radical SAM protein [Chloroflexota bacterium]
MLKKGLVVYEPRGRAGEYSPLALNLYRGCGHSCIYCYAPEATFIDQTEFIKATPRQDIIKKLKKDAPIASATYTGDDRKVLLCFTCDPYQPINDIHGLTRQAIEILHKNGFNVTILTKGGKRAERDFDLLTPEDNFAVTLTFLDEQKSLQWEPGAAIPEERIDSLRKAHRLGITTWVSLEPVIEPAETLEIIRQTHSFVDLFKVGKLNYHPRGKEVDWHKFLIDCIALLEECGSHYYIKKDLRRYSA